MYALWISGIGAILCSKTISKIFSSECLITPILCKLDVIYLNVHTDQTRDFFSSDFIKKQQHWIQSRAINIFRSLSKNDLACIINMHIGMKYVKVHFAKDI